MYSEVVTNVYNTEETINAVRPQWGRWPAHPLALAHSSEASVVLVVGPRLWFDQPRLIYLRSRQAKRTPKCRPKLLILQERTDSIYTHRERWFIVCLASFAAVLANIYFPVIPQISDAFHRSTEVINLMVMVASSSNVHTGARGLIFYSGLDTNHRVLGSFTSSVYTSREAGPAVGPAIAGAVADTLGRRLIFWVLCTLSATCFPRSSGWEAFYRRHSDDLCKETTSPARLIEGRISMQGSVETLVTGKYETAYKTPLKRRRDKKRLVIEAAANPKEGVQPEDVTKDNPM
ncbi:hypothetical protein HYDPIDRAFT_168761 [Hydnomerulius pinastri MD-312]|uniref:Major facilitator superfamily (MFS) profile domain-containing protein n=1 Tax=Hydnomerulius pinastri MD-312 TaxID=994086 RepID=A0A0C9W7M2_9AGAM|nr:hypothetical protein HYDPIDRAFT_189536 [Hydnomerulius pinastri MD-312]KIJ63218.1 hypothetical protein HYDPIDRAFT_168761 [Hydnomerulius pinastri MD-312]